MKKSSQVFETSLQPKDFFSRNTKTVETMLSMYWKRRRLCWKI